MLSPPTIRLTSREAGGPNKNKKLLITSCAAAAIFCSATFEMHRHRKRLFHYSPSAVLKKKQLFFLSFRCLTVYSTEYRKTKFSVLYTCDFHCSMGTIALQGWYLCHFYVHVPCLLEVRTFCQWPMLFLLSMAHVISKHNVQMDRPCPKIGICFFCFNFSIPSSTTYPVPYPSLLRMKTRH